MQKLILTCDSCGQRMQVPRSAIGRTGMCPNCGATIRITANNTAAAVRGKNPGGGGGLFGGRNLFWRGGSGSSGGTPTEEAKQRFGRAVDLFYGGKHAEALAIFDSLAKEYRDNPDIEAARQQCLSALQEGRGGPLAIEDQASGSGWGSNMPALPEELDEETVRRVVIEKLLRGRTEEVQLRAAEIASRWLGMEAGHGEAHAADAGAAPPLHGARRSRRKKKGQNGHIMEVNGSDSTGTGDKGGTRETVEESASEPGDDSSERD